MKLLVWVVCLLALGFLVPTAARCEENKLPDDAKSVLEKADQFELLSIDPAHLVDESSKDGFHRCKVLGKTAVTGDARKELMEGLRKGMEGKLSPARCFNPRHGIRATCDGKTVELLICFECQQIYVYVGPDEKGQRFLVSSEAEPAFDKVLSDAAIPKAK